MNEILFAENPTGTGQLFACGDLLGVVTFDANKGHYTAETFFQITKGPTPLDAIRNLEKVAFKRASRV